MPQTEIYIKLVVGFPNDQKVRALCRFGYPDAGLARDLYVAMVLHCKEYLTDGFVSAEQVGILAYPAPLETANQLAKQLASVGLTKEVSNPEAPGWQVCAFLKRNRSKAEVEALSEVRAESGRAGGLKPKKPRQRRSNQNAKQVANQPASNLDPKVQSTENTDASNEASVPPSAGATAPNIGDVVAAYVDGATQAGQPAPASSLRARVGKQARELLADGYDIAFLVGSAKRMGAGEWNDLAVQVRKDAASNGHRPQSAADTRRADVARLRELDRQQREGTPRNTIQGSVVNG